MDHDSDFYAWTQEQAAALRRVAETCVNLPGLDLDHLAEEVEGMGNDVLSTIEGLATRIVAHLLKLRFSPSENPRNHWKREVQTWRVTVAQRAKRSPSALKRIDLNDLHRSALVLVGIDAESEGWPALPQTCPFTLEQVLDTGWWPERRSGVVAGKSIADALADPSEEEGDLDPPNLGRIADRTTLE